MKMISILPSASNRMENCLDPQLWYACAGGMAQIPPPNSRVYYFPQGHAEHAIESVNFGGFGKIPPLIPCTVSSINYLADSETDEVYAKIRLIPLNPNNECASAAVDDECGFWGLDKNDMEREKSNSFAKTLTQSDANNGGGFSVPRYCAETIFPRLDYTAEPPVQTILAKDVHGEVWKFRHIYRGTPRRHLLTTGWSSFVNQKKLVAGDSIVFLRAENGDLCVGIRRAKGGGGCGGGGIGGGPESAVSCGWNTGASYRGFPDFLGGNGNSRKGDRGCVRAESVVEAAGLAARGREFEVVYYPRASTPEFVVKMSAVGAAMRVQWCAGMRFKMAFETEDSSRISWFMGTVSAVNMDDPIRWPNSPWRLLQVVWDEPELLHNLKRVNPWQVELVSNIPPIHLSPFSPPRKRPRFPQPAEFPTGGQAFIPMLLANPVSPSSPLCCLPDNISAGVQGTRHSSDLHFAGLKPFDFKLLDYARPVPKFIASHSTNLKMGGSTEKLEKERKEPMFVLFGKPILTAEQISRSSYSFDTGSNNSLSDGNQEISLNVSNGSGSAVIQNVPLEASSDGEFLSLNDQKLNLGMETGQCKVFVDTEVVDRTLRSAPELESIVQGGRLHRGVY